MSLMSFEEVFDFSDSRIANEISFTQKRVRGSRKMNFLATGNSEAEFQVRFRVNNGVVVRIQNQKRISHRAVSVVLDVRVSFDSFSNPLIARATNAKFGIVCEKFLREIVARLAPS